MSIPDPTAAFEKLPPVVATAFRACSADAEFVRDGQILVSRAPVSTTRNPSLLGDAPVLYAISGRTGRDVSPFSVDRAEEELVFLPGTVFALWGTIDVGGRSVRLVFETQVGETIDDDAVEAFDASVRAALQAVGGIATPRERFVGDIA